MDEWIDTRFLELEKADELREPSQLTEAHEILSCLVAQVYAFDEGEYESASEAWKKLGYELDAVKFWNQARSACGLIPVWRTCEIRAIVFRCRDDNAGRYLPNGELRPWQLPKFVVAIRGTKPCKVDLTDDIRIAFETLHTSHFFDTIVKQIQCVVKEHKAENVCVTGHSLGAAFGLLATRQLALEGTVLETHLFNPPFLSINTLLKKGWNAVKSLAAKTSSSSSFAKYVKRGFDWAMDSDRDAMFLKDNDEVFKKLERWTPNLYLNSHDPICNGYIYHFNKLKNHPETMRRSTSSFARLVRKVTPIEASSYHLIPSTNLVINATKPAGNLKRPTKKLIKSRAHALDEWHEHPINVNLRCEEYNLLQQDIASASN